MEELLKMELQAALDRLLESHRMNRRFNGVANPGRDPLFVVRAMRVAEIVEKIKNLDQKEAA